MCVVNKQFEFLEFVCNSLYVALKYNQIYLTFTVGYVCLCGVCSHCVTLGLSVTLCGGCGGCGDCDTCTGVCVGCEYAERVRGCERYGNACVVDGGGAVAMSVGHEYVGDVRGPGIVSSADDLLEMRVLRGMIGVREVCEMCMCLARTDVGGERVTG